MSDLNLRELYQDPGRIVVTAHRGWSARYPENTMIAFRQAVELGADIIEFDVRGTVDHVPVILHDATLDRTSDGTGSPNGYTLERLQGFNVSYWRGVHGDGRRLSEPAYPHLSIPTLEEVLKAFKGQVGLNIQVYEADSPLLSEICRLYRAYDLYLDGYLVMSTYREAALVREVDPQIELCVIERQGRMDPASLQRQKAFGCQYVQPLRDQVSESFCGAVRELGLYANMFYSNTDQDNRRFIGYGIQGILTDAPNVLLQTVRDMGLR